MKTTKKLLSILFIATLLSSCNVNMFNRVTGNGNVITKDRSTSENFTKIKVSTGLDLYITQGLKNKIIVEADENLHDIILTEINDGELRIYSEKGIWQASSKKIHVTVTSLEKLEANSGADVYTNGTIKSNSIEVNATSGADIRITVDADSVETNSTSGADLKINGVANTHTSSATSGASIDAYGLESKQVNVNVTSGADINVYAIESLKANATSGGDVDVKGNPKQVVKNTSSGGSISLK